MAPFFYTVLGDTVLFRALHQPFLCYTHLVYNNKLSSALLHSLADTQPCHISEGATTRIKRGGLGFSDVNSFLPKTGEINNSCHIFCL